MEKNSNLILKGRIPSKKNSKMIICRGRFPLLLPQKNYGIWHKQAIIQLEPQIKKLKLEKVIEKCEIILRFFAPDLRIADLSNKAESVMDLLVDMKVLKDDNWFVVGNLNLKFGGLDRENPRVEIEIYE